MRRELEDAAREGGVRSGSPVSLGGGGGALGCIGAGSNQGSLNDLTGVGGGSGAGGNPAGYYSEALPNSVHMKFVSHFFRF